MDITNPQVLNDNTIPALGRSQTFTESGVFTASKTGKHLIYIKGGGGGGGGAAGAAATIGSAGAPGQGGAEGIDSWFTQDLTAGDEYTVTIGAGGGGGAGGAAGNNNGINGTAGGETVFNGVAVFGGTEGYAGLPTFGSDTNPPLNGGTGCGPGGGQGANFPGIAGAGNAGQDANGVGSGGGGGSGGRSAGGTPEAGGAGGKGSVGFCLVIW
jgi:hypothetical protein